MYIVHPKRKTCLLCHKTAFNVLGKKKLICKRLVFKSKNLNNKRRKNIALGVFYL